MFCTACGTKNSQESNFCKQCGQRIEKPTTRFSEEEFNRSLPDNDQVGALMERAYALRLAGDFAGASALCEQALKLHPDSASAHSLLGQIYEQQGDTAKAIGEYETVLAHNPASIADRVKLDQLRDGDPKPAKVPQVVVTHPTPNSPPNIFAMIGVGAALILVGAIAANQMRPAATTPTNDANRLMPQNALASGSSATSPMASNGSSSPILSGNATNSTPTTTGTVMGSTPDLTYSPFFPPIVVNPIATNAAQNRTRQSYPFVDTSGDSANTGQSAVAQVEPPKNLSQKEAKPDRGDKTGSRTRLANDDGVVQDANGNYVISIDTGGNTKPIPNGDTRPAPTSPGRNTGAGSVSIKMAPVGGNGQKPTADNVTLASGDSRTSISIGKDLKTARRV